MIESVRGQEGNAQRVAASPCLSSSDSVDIDALRLAQLVVQPVAEVKLVEVDRLPESERGQGGFGSTGA